MSITAGHLENREGYSENNEKKIKNNIRVGSGRFTGVFKNSDQKYLKFKKNNWFLRFQPNFERIMLVSSISNVNLILICLYCIRFSDWLRIGFQK